MLGDKYIAKDDCKIGTYRIKKGEVLVETGRYNFETEEYEDSGIFNCLRKDGDFYICDVESVTAKKYFEKCMK